MKILVFDMGGYTYQDLFHHLKTAGHSCQPVYYHFQNIFEDDFFCRRFSKYLEEENYDVVISVNFFPLIAVLCDKYHVKYISWCYDSPLDNRLKDYFDYETNYVFLFDRIEVSRYQEEGYTQVFHLPLAVNTERLDALTFTPAQIKYYQSDISFVGHLYESPLDVLLYNADPYIKGYLEGIMQAQLRIYGYYFIDDVLTPDILDSLNTSLLALSKTAVPLNQHGLSHIVASKITHLERTFLLEQMGELYNTHLYTSDSYSFTTPVQLKGPVKYYSEMPGVFRYSKLNLCPTLKSIQSGIPLRALDIMGAKGVLLSNFQPELAEYFEDEKDCLMYSSIEDAFAKADFYLRHDDLREQIAINGYEKIRREFSYPQRIQEMFTIAKLL